MENKVLVENLGHSCYRFTYGGQRVVTDPYADGSVPGLPPLRTEAEFVYCSHDHTDHNAADCVTLLPHGEAAFSVTELPTEHDHHGGAHRGGNIIRIFDFGGLRVAHMGDIGRPLRAEEAAALRGVDLLLIPVGGYFTIDAAEAKDMIAAVAPRVTALMHFRDNTSDYDVIAHIDDILKILGPADYVGTAFELTPETPARTIIMKQK